MNCNEWRPRSLVKDRQHWTPREALRFLAARQHDPLAAIWWLALDTGIRRSELSELSWSDVDLGRGAVAVRNRQSGSPRAINLEGSTVAALEALVVRQLADRSNAGDTWVGGHPGVTGSVVASRTGRACLPTFLTRTFRHAQQGLDLPPIPFHGLRHTAFRIATTSGMPTHALAERFGHLDAESTLEVWPHLLEPSADDEPEGGQR